MSLFGVEDPLPASSQLRRSIDKINFILDHHPPPARPILFIHLATFISELGQVQLSRSPTLPVGFSCSKRGGKGTRLAKSEKTRFT
jgi:hypothetical protein